MDSRAQFELYAQADERRRGITVEKGAEYTNESVDVLANFKNIAERFGVSPLLVLGIYENKHHDSINTFIKRFIQAETVEDRRTLALEGEGILSRLDDDRNYLDLFEALLADLGAHPRAEAWKISPKWEELSRDPFWINRGQGFCAPTYTAPTVNFGDD